MKGRKRVGYAVIGIGEIAQQAVLPAFAHARKSSRLAAIVSSDPAKRRLLGRLFGIDANGEPATLVPSTAAPPR